MIAVGDAVKLKRKLCGEMLFGKIAQVVNEPILMNGVQFADAVYEVAWDNGDIGPRVREAELESVTR